MKSGIISFIATVSVVLVLAAPTQAQLTVTKVEGSISASASYQNGNPDSKSESLTSAGSFDKTVTAFSLGSYEFGGTRFPASASATASLKALIPNLSGSVIKGTAGMSKSIEPGPASFSADSSAVLKVTFTADQYINYVLSYNQTRNISGAVISLLDLSDFADHNITNHSYGRNFFGVFNGKVETTGQLTQGHTYQLVIDLSTNSGGFFFGNGTVDFTFTVGPATDVTKNVQITPSAFRYDSNTRSWVQRVTIKNISSTPIPGPISLVLDNLSSNATLKPADGVTKLTGALGSPYLDFALDGSSLPPGGVATVSLNVLNPTNAQFTYTPRILAGEGVR